jgi:hypothetical protein
MPDLIAHVTCELDYFRHAVASDVFKQEVKEPAIANDR